MHLLAVQNRELQGLVAQTAIPSRPPEGLQMNGWLKLHRQIIDSEVFANADLLRLWILLLARASVQRRFAAIPSGRGFTTVELKPGDAITGKKETSKLLGWPPSTFYDRLKRLEALGMIVIQPDTNASIVSIRNWLIFQGSEELDPDAFRPQSPTPFGSAFDTVISLAESDPKKGDPTPKSDHDPSTIRTRSVYDPTLIENEKKEKNEEKKRADKSARFDPMKVELPESLQTVAFLEAWESWVTHRKEAKNPITKTAACRQLQLLSVHGSEIAIKTIEASIVGGWSGLFPEKMVSISKTGKLAAPSLPLPVEDPLAKPRKDRPSMAALRSSAKEALND